MTSRYLNADFAQLVAERLRTFDILGVAGTTRLEGERWVGAGPPYIYGQIAEVDQKSGCYHVLIWGATAPVIANIQAMDGVLLCARRRVVDAVRFDEKTFDGFHLYDLDFTFAAYLKNLSLAVCTDFNLIHSSHGNWDTAWQRYGAAFLQKYHGRLMPAPNRQWQAAVVVARSKSELLEIMSPPHWRPVHKIP
jgi:hypothetical protein